MVEENCKDITVFIDESGTISKGESDKKDYFIITLLFVEDDKVDYVKKIFKKKRLQIVKKKAELMEELKDKGEIKGSALKESEKCVLYSKILEKCGSHFELAVIALDNSRATSRFKSNSSRAFNYLIKQYLRCYFKRYSAYRKLNSIKFIIDERNVATGSTYTLQEYLNTELNIMGHFAVEDISVKYSDSKKYLLLQMADFISNTFYRHIQKGYKNENIDLLLKATCKNEIFKFPL